MKKKTTRFGKFLKLFAAALVLISLVAITFVFLFISTLSKELPDISVLRNVQYQTPLNIYSKDGALIAQFGDKKRTPIAISKVPEKFVNAFLAAEDSRFYEHHGVDYRGILRASIQLLLTGQKKQGGSTITMQVTRNFLLSREKTYTRKLKEIMLALKIEKEFSKQDILELYLNKIYLGHHAYGIAAAAQIYYGKQLDELTLTEQAMIAGLPKAPSHYNPITDPERAKLRRNYVLRRMLKLKYISKKDHDISSQAAISAKLHTQPIEFSAPYIAEMTRNFIFEKYGESAYSVGLKVYTTIKQPLQRAANQALFDTLHAYDERHGYRNFPIPNINKGDDFNNFTLAGDTHPAIVTRIHNNIVTARLKDQKEVKLSWENLRWARKFITNNSIGATLKSASNLLTPGDIIRLRQLANDDWRLAQIPEVEGAFVSLDPTSGAILALTGGFDFNQSKYNRVTQSNRQPGSGFKPIIYTAALEAGYTAASIINDAPIVIDDKNQESEWRPENFSRKFFGPTRLRTALTKSRNLISIRLVRALGIPKVTNMALRFGFTAEQLPKSLTLALGSGQATPLQMAQLYAVFANNGFLIAPFFIDRIESNTGEILFQAQPKMACALCNENQRTTNNYAPRIVSPQIIFIMNSMLRDVVQRGTATRAKILGRKDLAGKTGTTNEQRDAWFNGFTSTNVASAWVGFDNSKLLGKRETGGKTALPMWISYMSEALKDVPEDEFIRPAGIVQVLIEPSTGFLTPLASETGISEFFRKEYVPTEFAMPTLQTNGIDDEETVEELF